jgi:hypothetical protein
VFKAPTNNNVSSLNNNNNNPFLGDLQKKLFPPKSDVVSVGNPDLDDLEGLSDDEEDEIEVKADSPDIRVSPVANPTIGLFTTTYVHTTLVNTSKMGCQG